MFVPTSFPKSGGEAAKVAHFFHRLSGKSILVVGDFMLDRYIFGNSRRISPEAPVPIVLVDTQEVRPGGAGNVVCNLTSLGCAVRVLGCVGIDTTGEAIVGSLEQEGVDTTGLIREAGFSSPEKVRIIASCQQVVRVDYERPHAIASETEARALQMIPELVRGVDLVAISDYAKGFVTSAIIARLIQEARSSGIPVITDPKGIDFAKYSGATVLKPNYSEAMAAGRAASLDEAARTIFASCAVDCLMVTRSEAGISLFYSDGRREDHPVAHAQSVRDVTGAGDTVLAVLSYVLANRFTIAEAAMLANIGGALAVEQVGCARISLADLAERSLLFSTNTKIFDGAHLPAVKRAFSGKKFSLLHIEQRDAHPTRLLQAVRAFEKNGDPLVVYAPHERPDSELVAFLAALQAVDVVLVQTPLSVKAELHPSQHLVLTETGEIVAGR